ncbi:hypothetical protein JW877_04500 [bacterium]|nr:hypothetical protein [bacterium]
MRLRAIIIIITAVSIFGGVPGQAVVGFEPGDWVTYKDFRVQIKVGGSRQYIYFLSTEGLIRFDTYTEQWEEPLSFRDIGFNAPPSNMWIKDEVLFFDYYGSIYSISEFNLTWRSPRRVYNTLELSLPQYPCPEEFPLFFTPYGYIFKDEGAIMDYNFREYEVVACYQDEWENLWMATWGGGAIRASLRDLRLEIIPFGLANSNIEAILIDGDSIWFGGWNIPYQESSGITLYDRNSEQWTYFDADLNVYMISDEVNCFEANKEFVFIGTSMGLVVYNKGSGNFTSYNTFQGIPDDEVTALCIKDEELWVGTETGIGKCIIGDFDFERASRIHFPEVYDIIYDGVTLWAGTSDGAYFLTGEGWRHFGTPDGYLDAPIWSLTLDGDYIWFAGQLGLLKMSTKGGSRELFPVTSVLPRTTFFDIKADNRYVWVATGNGVYRYRKNDKTWLTYYYSDGLASNTIWTIAPDGDYIWFGTPEGATRFLWNEPSRLDY